MSNIKSIIEKNFKKYSKNINYKNKNKELIEAVFYVIEELDKGNLRVANKLLGKWVINYWIKKAIFLLFLFKKNKLIKGAESNYFDKLESKFLHYDFDKFKKLGFRVVPPATIRKGAFISKNVVLMPSYVNIGAYIDEGCMIDTWSTVGSCAQIGKNVHLSGGVGIGGVLEPIQSSPTIIEDDCFIGARSEIVEGVIIEKGSVLSMGVYISKSTKIYDRNSKKIFYGRIPSYSVVVPGSFPSERGDYNLYCVVIVKKVNKETRKKIKINEILRDIN